MASPEKGMVGLDKTCCGYGDDGKKPGYDCLMVPSALNAAATRPIGIAAMISKQVEGAFCGNGGLLSENDKLAADSKTICCKCYIPPLNELLDVYNVKYINISNITVHIAMILYIFQQSEHHSWYGLLQIALN